MYETHLRGRIYLLEGDRLIGVVTNPTAGDTLYFAVHGKVYTGKPVESGL